MNQKKKIQRFLFAIDVFGAPFFMTIKNSSTKYKTKIGGIYTIILFFASIIYGAYKFKEQINNEISPKINQIGKSLEDKANFTFSHNLINIRVYGVNIQTNKQYFIPFIEKWYGQNLTTTHQRLTTQNCMEDNSFCLENDLYLYYNPDKAIDEEICYSIYLYRCNETLISENEQCANQSEMDHFLSITYIEVILQLNRFSKNKKKLEPYRKSFYLYLDSELYVSTDINIKTENLFFSSRYPFMKTEEYNYLSEVSLFPTNIKQSLGIGKNSYQMQAFGEIYFKLDANYIETKFKEEPLLDTLISIFNFFQCGYQIGMIFYFRSQITFRTKLRNKLANLYQKNNKEFIKEFKMITDIEIILRKIYFLGSKHPPLYYHNNNPPQLSHQKPSVHPIFSPSSYPDNSSHICRQKEIIQVQNQYQNKVEIQNDSDPRIKREITPFSIFDDQNSYYSEQDWQIQPAYYFY